jgi:hypothetical protein
MSNPFKEYIIAQATKIMSRTQQTFEGNLNILTFISSLFSETLCCWPKRYCFEGSNKHNF